jgi:predicted transcriptional regulator
MSLDDTKNFHKIIKRVLMKKWKLEIDNDRYKVKIWPPI